MKSMAFQNKATTLLSWLLTVVMCVVFIAWALVLVPLVLSGLVIIFLTAVLVGGVARAVVVLTNRFGSRSL